LTGGNVPEACRAVPSAIRAALEYYRNVPLMYEKGNLHLQGVALC
jgi:hypothetical protein